MKPRDDLKPAAWPTLVALVTVILLFTGLIIFDIIKDREAEERTTELVEKALHSVTVADGLRREVHALAAESIDPDARAAAIARIEHDAATYDPLATYAEERGEWTRLRGLLERLQAVGVHPADRRLLRDIEASLDRIVQINQRQAAENVAGILTAFHQDYAIDALGGTIAIVLTFVVGAALLRSIRRQRVLLAAHLAMKDQRQSDLEAFAGRVAHDLRGPLAPIRSYADLLRLGGGPSPAELGKRIENATDRMGAIIDDLLTLSLSGKPEVGEAELAPVVAQVLDDVGPLPRDGTVKLAITDDKIRCSRAALCRIVQNLISNAIKFAAPERPLELGVTATRRDGMVELVVSDNGVGMDEPTAAHAFDPLFRGRATSKVPGTGLGLAIVKRTVDVLGGICRIDSKLGEGTRIVVRLPATA
ncbi:MAG TPA: HAMP domain-containing sensor histidine kinase [Kofleriaceae bacterium]|nr:HAMP domain-containing sensor histidine kinase [Kofleriaceae bacterium]